jgi:hypothetical protein
MSTLAAVCVLAAGAILATTTMRAQESATLIMRSGDRIAGELVDLGGVGFTIRVNGAERRVPPSDVAVIDFNGAPPSPEAQAKINAGAQFVMLRNGQTIDGHLFDIGGTSPLRMTIDTPSGRRDLASNEIAQVYMAGTVQSQAAAAQPGLAAPGAPGAGRTITVPANQQWTATGINVRQGWNLQLTSSGEIQFSPDGADRAAPAGNGINKRNPSSPLPEALAGALIGRIGNGQAFGVGNLTTLRVPANGPLFLGINDDNVADNAGNFQVSIVVPRR